MATGSVMGFPPFFFFFFFPSSLLVSLVGREQKKKIDLPSRATTMTIWAALFLFDPVFCLHALFVRHLFLFFAAIISRTWGVLPPSISLLTDWGGG
ncbi:uncharacterized protein IWZ02DRAFT_445671 [Phyllosticta citriasiana]|uniref:uncharacterized protein n=1 Tax=Phyllosticta citriasiana TaxID=595635 RepID=UPI0030FD8BE1